MRRRKRAPGRPSCCMLRPGSVFPPLATHLSSRALRLHSIAATRIRGVSSLSHPFVSEPHRLDVRARHLLRTLIAQYLEEGQPVGSRTLARSAGLDVSPATVRNIMADLEELGLIASPHTSAGRVPTVSGLRLFVDSLLELKPLPRGAVIQMQRELPRESASPRELLRSEERRVGKECRARWSTDHGKKKKR